MNFFERERVSHSDDERAFNFNELMRSRTAAVKALLRLGIPQDSVKLDLSAGTHQGSQASQHAKKPNTEAISGANPNFELPDNSYKRIGILD